jgi:hypothetical protein
MPPLLASAHAIHNCAAQLTSTTPSLTFNPTTVLHWQGWKGVWSSSGFCQIDLCLQFSVGLKAAHLPLSIAFCAYSVWKIFPSGE